jgi:hypothetical protein
VIRALRALGVNVVTVADFDILNDEIPLRPIVEASGGDWGGLVSDWRIVKTAIESKRAELSTNEVRKEVAALLESITEQQFPDAGRKRLAGIFKRSSPWAHAKAAGKGFVPSGEATNAYSRMTKQLRQLNLCIVEVGEVERFVPSVADHGPSWVAQVLETKVLATDPELSDAREFLQLLVNQDRPVSR